MGRPLGEATALRNAGRLRLAAFELSGRAAARGLASRLPGWRGGETVELSCEKSLFGSAEAVAAATSYVAARVLLLSNGANYGRRNHATYEDAMPGLRRTLEIDRFGFVAQVLANTYNCSAEACTLFGLFNDNTRLRANLKERPFDAFVARNSTAWSTPPSGPTVASAPPTTPPPAPTTAGGPSPVPPGFKVPSASSIPPVSIMNPEPPASASQRNPPPLAATETHFAAPAAAPNHRAANGRERSAAAGADRAARGDRRHAPPPAQ